MSDERFRLRRELGTGTWGTVYEAEDLEERRAVALKVLHPVWERHATAAGALQRDLVRLRRVDHPNVARVYGLHVLSGRSALVQELVPGLDVAALLRRVRAEGGRVPVQAALELAAQVAEALAAAHAEGVLHRGLKPGNLIVGVDASCRVLDFAVARDDFDEAEAFTQSVRYGSLRYREPERRHGGVALPEGDVYALGALLYELLALRPLGNSEASAERHQERVVGAVAELATSEAVRELVGSMLSHAPEQRPTAADVAERAKTLAREADDGGLGTIARAYVPAAAALFDETTEIGELKLPPELLAVTTHQLPPPKARGDWVMWVSALGLGLAFVLILVPR